ncbi:MAG: DUF4249 domain-containing protein [Saprospiraceae bacterium]|nr:DUF4249 domain-containing protein [Saprospiraceae bacterium]
MKKIATLFALLLMSLLLVRCIDEVKLDIDSNRTWVNVDGLVTDSLQVQTIKIKRSAVIGVGNDNILTPVEGCTVKVLDDGGQSFDFTETEPGVYTHEMQGVPGRTYYMEAKLPDGKTILSRPSVLMKAPPLLPITAEVTQKTTIGTNGRAITTNQLSLGMNTEIGASERPYLRWRATGEYEFKEAYPMALNTKTCYIKNNLDFNNIKIFDPSELEGTSLKDEPFLNTAFDYRFADQYCFHLFQYAMSEDEYQYWEQMRDIVTIDGSLFDPPPGTVQGNLYDPNDPDELILGYFSVAGVAYSREFVNANSLGFFVEPRCSSLPFRPQYPDCRACETILFSSLEKPLYWP